MAVSALLGHRLYFRAVEDQTVFSALWCCLLGQETFRSTFNQLNELNSWVPANILLGTPAMDWHPIKEWDEGGSVHQKYLYLQRARETKFTCSRTTAKAQLEV